MKNDLEIRISVPNHTRYLSLIGKIGENMAQEMDRPPCDRDKFAYHINMVLTEAVVNAIKHANNLDPDKQIDICISLSGQELSIKVHDSGKGFDIELVPQPCFEPNHVEDKGRGIFIIKSLMDSVEYFRSSSGNVLVMKKKLKKRPARR